MKGATGHRRLAGVVGSRIQTKTSQDLYKVNIGPRFGFATSLCQGLGLKVYSVVRRFNSRCRIPGLGFGLASTASVPEGFMGSC